jgi:geranylgeranyl diphosphate synthase type II
LDFLKHWEALAQNFNNYSLKYFEATNWSAQPEVQNLKKSIQYSLCGEGKRFRPVLAQAIYLLENKSVEKVLPFCLSVEMIHSYSLIHDDLPCMDNDDFRRGKPTNHKIYGEGVALLAGDALLTESFLVSAKNYPDKAHLLIQFISEKAGMFGMIAGQAIDMKAQKEKMQIEDLRQMHLLKTGALFELSIVGAGLILGLSDFKLTALKDYSQNLGLAFQIKDDLLDFEPKSIELGSYPAILGLEETQKLLDLHSEQAQNAIIKLNKIDEYKNAQSLVFLSNIVKYNLGREK